MNNVVAYKGLGTAKVYAQAYEYSPTGLRTSPYKSPLSRKMMNKALMLLKPCEYIQYTKLDHI